MKSLANHARRRDRQPLRSGLGAVVAVVALGVSSTALAAEDGAGDPAVDAVVQKVEARYASVDTIQADFTQSKTDAFGQISQDGDVVVARPAKMRWRFTSGDEQVFATDGQTLTIWTKADNYYQQMPDSTSGSASVQGFLTSLDQLDEVFAVTLVEDGEQGPTLDLVPHKAGAIASVRLDLDAELTVEQVTMTDTYGNVTDIAFREMRFDQPVDDAIFNFPKPGPVTDR